mmetsp:Transcript_19584/g.62333  ORF Transcript_19584/g.62333 Transcript_19584/m.62333 type:complete len:216 (+) Transcript_19584:91-738(+)
MLGDGGLLAPRPLGNALGLRLGMAPGRSGPRHRRTGAQATRGEGPPHHRTQGEPRHHARGDHGGVPGGDGGRRRLHRAGRVRHIRRRARGAARCLPRPHDRRGGRLPREECHADDARRAGPSGPPLCGRLHSGRGQETGREAGPAVPGSEPQRQALPGPDPGRGPRCGGQLQPLGRPARGRLCGDQAPGVPPIQGPGIGRGGPGGAGAARLRRRR